MRGRSGCAGESSIDHEVANVTTFGDAYARFDVTLFTSNGLRQ